MSLWLAIAVTHPCRSRSVFGCIAHELTSNAAITLFCGLTRLGLDWNLELVNLLVSCINAVQCGRVEAQLPGGFFN